MKIKITEPVPNIFYLEFETQYQVAMTFMRIQEYYESPYKSVKGKYFSVEQYMDEYAKVMGNFDYTIEWEGFNIPGHIVNRFEDEFEIDLTNKELILLHSISNALRKSKNYQGYDDFYIIAGFKAGGKSVINHEIAHGMYYLNKDYKKEVDALIKNTMLKTFRKCLLKQGYCKEVLNDEIQAYLATSTGKYIEETFKLNNGMDRARNMFRGIFKKHLKAYHQ